MAAQDDISDPATGEGLIAAIHSLSHKLMMLYSQIVYAPDRLELAGLAHLADSRQFAILPGVGHLR